MEIPSYFRRYLKEIQPSRASRERASQLHTTVRNRLSADESFKDWYSDAFLYGSYRRNTAIKEIKDVDVCVELAVDQSEHKPEEVVQRLRKVLETNGYADKTALQRRSVRIDMSGTTLDIVPVTPLVSGGDSLLIPDRPLESWVSTYPREHLQVVTDRNKECNGRFIPLVKIVKAWYRYQRSGAIRPKPKGFTLEALVIQYQDKDAPTYAEAFIAFLENLEAAAGHVLAVGSFPNVPDPGRVGQYLRLRMSEDEAKRFGGIVKLSLEQAKKALEATTVAGSAEAWSIVFGPDFPKVPVARVTKASEVMLNETTNESLEDDIDHIMEREIMDLELPPTGNERLKIRAGLSRTEGGRIEEFYANDGRSLPKGWHLRFEVVRTSVEPPYEVRWTVENHGEEAHAVPDPGHVVQGRDSYRWERLAYRGSHRMICELVRDGMVLARTTHIVNVGRR